VVHGPADLVQHDVAEMAALMKFEVYFPEVHIDEAFDVGLWSKSEEHIFDEKTPPLICQIKDLSEVLLLTILLEGHNRVRMPLFAEDLQTFDV